MFKHQITPDAELRLLFPHHADELYALTDANRDHLRQFMPWVNGTKSVEDTKAFIKSVQEQFAANKGFHAGIWYQGNLAGTIGYHTYDLMNNSTQLGYWLGEEFQGKGLMTEACRAMVDYAFNELKLNRVVIHTATANLKSQGIPERLGFQREGLLREAERITDHYVDHIVYAMLAKDWRKDK